MQNIKTLGVITFIALSIFCIVSCSKPEPTEAKDYGFMQQRSFEDPDGNLWELIYMDMSQMPQE